MFTDVLMSRAKTLREFADEDMSPQRGKNEIVVFPNNNVPHFFKLLLLSLSRLANHSRLSRFLLRSTKMVFTKSTIRHHRKSLIEAFKEFYRGLCLLENFCKVLHARPNAQRNLCSTSPNHTWYRH